MSYSKKKFILSGNRTALPTLVEIKGLNSLLEMVVKEENYEMASLIRDRLKNLTEQGYMTRGPR